MIAMSAHQLLITTGLALLCIAVISDMRQRQIPNLLVVTGLVLGFAGQFWLAGPSGFGTAVLGAIVGFLCLLPFYISGGMGAGDVKLMAMCGAYLGPFQIAIASVTSLIVGGVIGIAWYFWWWQNSDDTPGEDSRSGSLLPAGIHTAAPSSIPYSLAIAAGVLIAFMATPLILQIFM